MYGCALKKSLTIRTVLLHFLKLEKGQAHSESKDMTITCSVKLLDVCMYLKWLFCFEVLAGMGINLSDFAHRCMLAPPTLDPDNFLPCGKLDFISL